MVSESELFTVDVFLQSDYSGKYVLKPGLQLCAHVQIHRLGEVLHDPIADEAFWNIQMMLMRKEVALLGLVPFVKHLFQPQYNSPKSQRIREVAAAYAVYHDAV